jgi:CheY-like chemotaxis protein
MLKAFLLFPESEVPVQIYRWLVASRLIPLVSDPFCDPLVAARSVEPDLFLLDLDPSAGWVLLERLRADPGFSAIPVLAITSSRQPDDRSLARSLGARAVLHKPVDQEAFVRALGRLRETQWPGGKGWAGGAVAAPPTAAERDSRVRQWYLPAEDEPLVLAVPLREVPRLLSDLPLVELLGYLGGHPGATRNEISRSFAGAAETEVRVAIGLSWLIERGIVREVVPTSAALRRQRRERGQMAGPPYPRAE